MKRLFCEKPEMFTFLLIFIVQICLGVWWAADLNRRVVRLEDWRIMHGQTLQRLVRLEADNDSQNKDLIAIRSGVDRLEAKMTDIQKSMWQHLGETEKATKGTK